MMSQSHWGVRKRNFTHEKNHAASAKVLTFSRIFLSILGAKIFISFLRSNGFSVCGGLAVGY